MWGGALGHGLADPAEWDTHTYTHTMTVTVTYMRYVQAIPSLETVRQRMQTISS